MGAAEELDLLGFCEELRNRSSLCNHRRFQRVVRHQAASETHPEGKLELRFWTCVNDGWTKRYLQPTDRRHLLFYANQSRGLDRLSPGSSDTQLVG